MALRNILTSEDPFLRRRCREITNFGDRTSMLIDDLIDTLREVDGQGLAAPQVGILRRVAVLIEGEDVIELINPEITEKEGEEGMDEACLSCPGIIGYVVRPDKVKVRAYNRSGDEFEREFQGLPARAVCHEIDHLDGVLFVDLAEKIYESVEEYRAANKTETQSSDVSGQPEKEEKQFENSIHGDSGNSGDPA